MLFEERGHRLLLGTLARCGRIQEEARIIAATIRLFGEVKARLGCRFARPGEVREPGASGRAPRNPDRHACRAGHIDTAVEPGSVTRRFESVATRRASICVAVHRLSARRKEESPRQGWRMASPKTSSRGSRKLRVLSSSRAAA